MNTETAGILTLYALSLMAGSAGTWRLIRQEGWMGTAVAYAAATLFVGLGLYGPEFLRPYSRFLDDLITAATQGGQERETAYEEFLDAIGRGEVPDRVSEVGMAFMLDNPAPQMTKLYDAAAQRATDPVAKRQIEAGKQHYEVVEKVAAHFAASGEFEALPPEQRADAARPILMWGDERLRQLRIDPRRIERLRTLPRKP
ncbi:MAG: hypothetical protein AAF628_34380 [Planctomycetota bacterium]